MLHLSETSSYPSPILSFNGYYSLALVSQLGRLVCLLMKIRLKLNRIKIHFNPPIAQAARRLEILATRRQSRFSLQKSVWSAFQLRVCRVWRLALSCAQ